MTLRNDSTIRQYRPAVGKLIKMALWEDYISRGIDVWSWLRVVGIDDSTVTVRHATHPSKPSQDKAEYTIPLYVVAPPLGWEPRYTIYCKPEEVEKVLGWFARGVVNRANHDLGSSRGCVWQPMDNAGTPHWSYPELTDTIPPADCARLLRVVKVETEDLGNSLLGSMGRSKRVKAIAAMKADGWTVRYVPYAGGFWERQRETVVHEWD